MPKVSVIVPIYNVASYLPDTIDSALKQTEPNIEILLVDDGSTDGSGALCDRYAAQDDRIRVIHKENGGLSSARNAGVAASKGAYILLLDGDDRLRPDAVARTVAVMEETGADLVQFRYRELWPGKEPAQQVVGSCVTTACTPEALFENLYRLGGEGASACTKLFRRELLEQLPFEDTCHEDEQWCTSAFVRPLKAAYMEDTLYDYVMRDGSIIRSGFHPAQLDVLKVNAARIEVLARLGLTACMQKTYAGLNRHILRLYRDAKNAGDRKSVAAIKSKFQQQKDGIRKHAKLRGKFWLLFCLMCIRFEAAELYRIYWKLRRNHG